MSMAMGQKMRELKQALDAVAKAAELVDGLREYELRFANGGRIAIGGLAGQLESIQACLQQAFDTPANEDE